MNMPDWRFLWHNRGAVAKRAVYRAAHGHPRWWDYPTAIQLDTHNYCNLQCSYCNPQGAFEMEHGRMPLETMEAVLEYFEGYDIDLVAPFMNGDGLLERRLPEIVAMSKKHLPKAKIDVFTNGVAFENRELLRNRQIDRVHFTISATTPETYNLVHGRPYFQRALKTLAWLAANKPPKQEITICFVPTKDNYREIPAWRKLFAQYQQNVRPLHQGLERERSKAVRDEDRYGFSEMVTEAWDVPDFSDLRFGENAPCAVWSILAISWRGEIMQCCDEPYEYNYGKIGRRDILDAWRERRKIGLDHPACAGCNFKRRDWREILGRFA